MKKPPPYIHDAADADAIAALTRIARREAIQKKIPEIQDKLKTIERIEPGSLAFWEIVFKILQEMFLRSLPSDDKNFCYVW